MPPRREVGDDAQLGEARQVGVVLDLQVRAGHPHAIVVAEPLAGQLHGVEHHARGALAHAVRVQVEAQLVQLHDDLGELGRLKGGVAQLAGVGVGRHQRRGLDLHGAVHEDLEGVHLEVLGVELPVEALELRQGLVLLGRDAQHVAAVDVDGQPPLPVVLAQAGVDPLVDVVVHGPAGVEDGAHADALAVVDPAVEGGVNLLVGDVIQAVEDEDPARRLEGVAGEMAVPAHVVGQPRHGVGRVVGDAVQLEDLGVRPVAVYLVLEEHELGVRADPVELVHEDVLAAQELALHEEAVALLAGVLLDVVLHKVEGRLLAVRLDAQAELGVLEADARGDVHVAVDDAGHDEPPAEVADLALEVRKARLVAHVGELAVPHHEGGRQGLFLVRREDLRVLDDYICHKPNLPSDKMGGRNILPPSKVACVNRLVFLDTATLGKKVGVFTPCKLHAHVSKPSWKSRSQGALPRTSSGPPAFQTDLSACRWHRRRPLSVGRHPRTSSTRRCRWRGCRYVRSWSTSP